MLLPKKISPNPLITSVVEIRFTSDLMESEVLSSFFPIFSEDLPKLKNGDVPKELKEKEKQLQFAADYIMSNDTFRVAFSQKAISFEIVQEYPLWEEYFQFIKKQLGKFLENIAIKSIDRIGVRYASLLEGVLQPEGTLKYIPTLSIENYDEKFVNYRTELKNDSYTSVLVVAKNAKVTKENISRSGLYIDIDTFIQKDIASDSTIFSIIDEMHLEQKKIFFSLLKPEFILTLNPQY